MIGRNILSLIACAASLLVLNADAAEPSSAVKPARIFPDAPPPPIMSETLLCCTATGRWVRINPEPGDAQSMDEGVSCHAKTPSGEMESGKACF
ncbi:MAG: hypothetical protein ABL892_08755 [Thiobacillaceae bacterium]